jgi:hypothetical protein
MLFQLSIDTGQESLGLCSSKQLAARFGHLKMEDAVGLTNVAISMSIVMCLSISSLDALSRLLREVMLDI